MTKAVQRRRGTNAEHSSFTGLEGELSVNTTNDSVHVHDGATAGGFELARADGTNVDDFSVGGDLDVTGNVTIGGNITIGDADTDSININADLTSSLIPNADDTYDLGTATKQWRNLYIDGTAEIDSLSINGVAITASVAELNILDGVTASTAELNILDGVTATTAELNILDGVTSTAAELNALDGITSTVTELNYTDGVTSAIQTQLDAKAPIDAATFTGTTTIPTADINGGTIDGVTIGGSSAAAGTFTTGNFSGDITFTHANPLIVGGDTDGSLAIGGYLSNQGANITLYGDTATTANDMNFRADTTIWMKYDHSDTQMDINVDATFAGNVTLSNGALSATQSADTFASGGVKVIRSSNAAQYGVLSNHGGATFLTAVDEGNLGNDILVFGKSVDGTSITGTARIDSSGNFFVNQTSTSSYITTEGIALREVGLGTFTRDDGIALLCNRLTDHGTLVSFRKDNATKGEIVSDASGMAYTGIGSGLMMRTSDIIPTNGSGVGSDNLEDLGDASFRFDDVFATNGSIQTSDEREKQDIEELTQAEQNVAVACKGLLRKYRWIDAVAEKGDNARIHFGIIAQDLKAAFEAEGLDAGRYAMFTDSEWWETSTDVAAVEAQDAVYEDVTIPAVTEEQLVTEAVVDDEGNEVEAAVYETVVVEEESTEQRLVSEAIEAKEAYTRKETYDTEAEAPEGAIRKERMGVRYNELLAFIIAAI